MLAIPACSGSENGWNWQRQKSIQTSEVHSDATKPIKAIDRKVDNFYKSQFEELMIRAGYLRALPTLKLTIHDEWHPNPEAIVQKLLDHPEEAIKILEGCDRFWRTSFDDYPIPADAEIRPWTAKALRTRLQNRSMNGVQIHLVDDNIAVITEACGGGNYNYHYTLYLYQEKQNKITIEPINTPDYNTDTGTIISDNTNINYGAGVIRYDPKTYLFTHYLKYGGSGACGKLTTYRLRNNRFVIQEVREESTCPFLNPLLPEELPLIYP
ncbi:MAG: hypothetical protein F6J87_12825 [Spirulina sp. SIO3F2]|nr:hypothetical protein [Spirulina sp. SIO3F2]